MPPTLTRSCVHRMIAATIGTIIRELTVINVAVRISLTTFPVHFMPSTIILMVAIFLAFVTSLWIWVCIVPPSPLYSQLLFWGYFGGVKLHYICIRLYCFPSFFILFSLESHLAFLTLFLFLRWWIRRDLYFSQPPYLHSGIYEGQFWQWYCEISISCTIPSESSSPPSHV